jgi:membrane-associated phospholipid phosphatase
MKRRQAGRDGSVTALAPPWAPAVAIAVLTLGGLLTAMVWHATQLNPFDAWVLHWQELAHHRGQRVAAIISGTVLPVALLTAVAGAAAAWLADRWDALVLALVAVPSTLCVNAVLKRLVHRQWPGGPELLYPSGHLALATAVALVAVLVVRVIRSSSHVRRLISWLAGGYVLVITVARLVEEVHSLTDLLGGGATGLLVTLGAALGITAWSGRESRRRLQLPPPVQDHGGPGR